MNRLLVRIIAFLLFGMIIGCAHNPTRAELEARGEECKIEVMERYITSGLVDVQDAEARHAITEKWFIECMRRKD